MLLAAPPVSIRNEIIPWSRPWPPSSKDFCKSFFPYQSTALDPCSWTNNVDILRIRICLVKFSADQLVKKFPAFYASLCKINQLQGYITGSYAETWVWFTLSGCMYLEISFSVILPRPSFPNDPFFYVFPIQTSNSFRGYCICTTCSPCAVLLGSITLITSSEKRKLCLIQVCSVTHYPLGDFSGDKAAGSGTEDSSPCSAEDMNVWSYTSIPHVFENSSHFKRRNNSFVSMIGLLLSILHWTFYKKIKYNNPSFATTSQRAFLLDTKHHVCCILFFYVTCATGCIRLQ
jgi:hypothetical protein